MDEAFDVNDFTTAAAAMVDPKQNPRVVAIMAASYLEDYLGRALRTKMPSLSRAMRSKLFESGGLLSTMQAKIDLSNALGLIPGPIKSDLINIARIRNRFAHNIHVCDFDDIEVAKFCSKLSDHAPVNVSLSDIQAAKRDPDYVLTNRDKFVWTASMIGMMVHNYLVQFHSLTALKTRAEASVEAGDISAMRDIADQISNAASTGS